MINIFPFNLVFLGFLIGIFDGSWYIKRLIFLMGFVCRIFGVLYDYLRLSRGFWGHIEGLKGLHELVHLGDTWHHGVLGLVLGLTVFLF
jgi:hypothetical protein